MSTNISIAVPFRLRHHCSRGGLITHFPIFKRYPVRRKGRAFFVCASQRACCGFSIASGVRGNSNSISRPGRVRVIVSSNVGLPPTAKKVAPSVSK